MVNSKCFNELLNMLYSRYCPDDHVGKCNGKLAVKPGESFPYCLF